MKQISIAEIENIKKGHSEDLTRIINTEEEMIKSYENKKNLFSGNTTIGIVTTNAKLNKAVVQAVINAGPVYGLKSYSELNKR